MEIFDEKKKFIYFLFQKELHTDIGKYLVRLHQDNYYAQAVYMKLTEHAKKSTHTPIDTSDLIIYLTSLKLHPINWEVTSHSFILYLCDKLQLYE